MTPAQIKAKELVDSIWKIVENEMPAKRHIEEVKMLAKLIVDENIKYAKLWGDMADDDIKEFEEVKQEINNLN
jgi:hypothetical protein